MTACSGGTERPAFLIARSVLLTDFSGVIREELKKEVVALSKEERVYLAAYLRHLARVDTEENRTELSAANARIDTGDFVTLEQFRRIHAALEAEGL